MKRATITLLLLTLASSVTGVRADTLRAATPSVDGANDGALPAVHRGASHRPMTLVCAVPSVCQSNRQGNGVGVRSSGLASMSAPFANGASSSVQGVASWYAASGDIAAAPWWRFGMDPVWATVTHFRDGQSFSVTVLIQDFCQCYVGTPQERAIDLSDDAFRQLAPLSVGVLTVTIEVPGQGPRVTAPPTDTAP